MFIIVKIQVQAQSLPALLSIVSIITAMQIIMQQIIVRIYVIDRRTVIIFAKMLHTVKHIAGMALLDAL
jgi:hypothetical protein